MPGHNRTQQHVASLPFSAKQRPGIAAQVDQWPPRDFMVAADDRIASGLGLDRPGVVSLHAPLTKYVPHPCRLH